MSFFLMRSRKVFITLATIAAIALIAWIGNAWMVGRVLARHREVPVCDNGFLFSLSHGRNYSKDGYYFGQKWQCVEFVKRFYFEKYGLRMPDVWGHAKDYFDPKVAHRSLNAHRGMLQFVNGGDEPPALDDLLVFTDTAYGHVAIVTNVTADSVEVVQQNILGRPRQKFVLKREAGLFSISSPRSPSVWLRPLGVMK